MSMSTHVTGFRRPDTEWHNMKAIWDLCKASDIDAPQEVIDYFDYKEPESAGQETSNLGSAVTQYRTEMCEGFTIELAKLPKHITHVRVFNSY